MIVDEEFFSPFRPTFGGDRQELHPFWWSKMDVEEVLPRGMFSATWVEFQDDMPEPDSYGDTGRDQLEIVLLLAFLEHVPVLVSGIPWLALVHQAGGVACDHPQFIARRLRPRPSIYPKLRRIARDRWPNDAGDRYDPSCLVQTSKLKLDLNQLGLTCDHTIHCFTEGVYPIDATDEAISIVSEEYFVLADLIVDFDPCFERSNLAILILSANSD